MGLIASGEIAAWAQQTGRSNHQGSIVADANDRPKLAK
jgi:hypothetical protein